MEKIISNMDWKLLRGQKLTLVQLTMEKENSLTNEEREDLDGIIQLVDAVQDLAVEEYGLSEKEVFNLEDE